MDSISSWCTFSQIPKEVKIFSNQRITALFQGFTGCIYLLKQGCFFLFLGNLFRMFLTKVSKAWAGRLLAWLMPAIGDSEFDLIVDYNGQQQLYYMVNKLKGKKEGYFLSQ